MTDVSLNAMLWITASPAPEFHAVVNAAAMSPMMPRIVCKRSWNELNTVSPAPLVHTFLNVAHREDARSLSFWNALLAALMVAVPYCSQLFLNGSQNEERTPVPKTVEKSVSNFGAVLFSSLPTFSIVSNEARNFSAFFAALPVASVASACS